MLARPSHHTICLATLFGSFEWEKVSDFELNGSLSHRALPALRQLTDDLTRLLPSWPGFVWGWVPAFFGALFSQASQDVTASQVRCWLQRVWWSLSKGSNLHHCSESLSARRVFLQELGCSCTKLNKVHGYKSPTIVQLKRQHVSTVQVCFCFREVCKPSPPPQSQTQVLCETEGPPDASHVPSRRSAASPPKNRGKKEEKAGVFGFANQGDRGEAKALVAAVEQAASHYQSQNPAR